MPPRSSSRSSEMCGPASPGSRASIRIPAAFGRFFSPPAGAGKELAMMRSTLACGALVVVLLGPPAPPAPPAPGAQGSFEGLVVYKVSDAEGKSGLMRYYQLGNRTRQEFEMNGVAAVSIFDGTTGDIITLVPQQKQYLVMNMKQLGQKMGDMAQALQGQQRATGDQIGRASCRERV